MANELEIINNPTSTPAAVSTGYQRQNTRMLAASNGIDNTYVEVIDASTVRLAKSGAVDISGTLYAVGESEDFTVSSAGRYYIYLADGSDASHKTPTIGTDAGTFDAELNARYLATGERVLNWLIVKETVGSTKLTVLRITDPGKLAAHNEPLLLARVEITSAGTTTWTAPRSQVYTFELQACGGDGGAKSDSMIVLYGGGGGGGGGYIKHSEFIIAGTVLTLTKSISSGGSNQISGTDMTTLTAINGYDGGNAYYLDAKVGIPGAPGAGTGAGLIISGGYGCAGAGLASDSFGGIDVFYIRESTYFGGNGDGGGSFMGNPGHSIYDRRGFGAGGAGSSPYNPSPSTGGPGLFLIWG